MATTGGRYVPGRATGYAERYQAPTINRQAPVYAGGFIDPLYDLKRKLMAEQLQAMRQQRLYGHRDAAGRTGYVAGMPSGFSRGERPSAASALMARALHVPGMTSPENMRRGQMMIEAIGVPAAHEGLMQTGRILGSLGGAALAGAQPHVARREGPWGNVGYGYGGGEGTYGDVEGIGFGDLAGPPPGFNPMRTGIVQAQRRFGRPTPAGTELVARPGWTLQQSYEKGTLPGTVPKTGKATIHKGEIIIPREQVTAPLLSFLIEDAARKGTLASPSKSRTLKKGYQEGTLESPWNLAAALRQLYENYTRRTGQPPPPAPNAPVAPGSQLQPVPQGPQVGPFQPLTVQDPAMTMPPMGPGNPSATQRYTPMGRPQSPQATIPGGPYPPLPFEQAVGEATGKSREVLDDVGKALREAGLDPNDLDLSKKPKLSKNVIDKLQQGVKALDEVDGPAAKALKTKWGAALAAGAGALGVAALSAGKPFGLSDYLRAAVTMSPAMPVLAASDYARKLQEAVQTGEPEPDLVGSLFETLTRGVSSVGAGFGNLAASALRGAGAGFGIEGSATEPAGIPEETAGGFEAPTAATPEPESEPEPTEREQVYSELRGLPEQQRDRTKSAIQEMRAEQILDRIARYGYKMRPETKQTLMMRAQEYLKQAGKYKSIERERERAVEDELKQGTAAVAQIEKYRAMQDAIGERQERQALLGHELRQELIEKRLAGNMVREAHKVYLNAKTNRQRSQALQSIASQFKLLDPRISDEQAVALAQEAVGYTPEQIEELIRTSRMFEETE